MLEVSFSWTLGALLHGDKTVTRRWWTDTFARRFKKGVLVAALDKDRRNGGKPKAIIEVTQDAYQDADLLTVGIRDAYRHGLAIAILTENDEMGWAMDKGEKP